jgi:arylsulfatase A-like enzyme
LLERYFPDEPEESPEDEDGPEEPLTPLPEPATGLIDPDDFAFLERLQTTYAAAMTHLDHWLGVLVEELERAALLEELLIVVASDRGLALGEHGLNGDGRPWLHDELIHLPLIVRLPGAAEAGRRVAALTQPVDLAPTLLEWFGLPVPPVHGHSLLPLVRGDAEQVRPYACAALALGEAEEWALRAPAWALVLPVRVPPAEAARPPQLYVKPDDRWEVNNVIQHHLELAEGLERTLRGFAEAVCRDGPLPPLPEGV